MSAYITLMTPMLDRECLLKALSDLGFGPQKVEVHEIPTQLMGYQGDSRSEVANIIIRKKHIGLSSNDIGFLATPTGYKSIISDFDRNNYGNSWMQNLGERYKQHEKVKLEKLAEEERMRLDEERKQLIEVQRRSIHERATKLGYQVKEVRDGDAIRLTLVKRTY